jgi:hypothetical protein
MSFGIDYAKLKEVTEFNIARLTDGTSTEDLALVAMTAYQLQAIGMAPNNIGTLISRQQAAINGLELTESIDKVAIQAASAIPRRSVIWRMQEFLVDGTFTAPDNLAGDIVYITGCGGGGSGGARFGNATSPRLSTGGSGGFYTIKQPIPVIAGDAYAVTIGFGGAPVTTAATSDGNAGGATTFGSLLTLKGGQQGIGATSTNVQPKGGFNAGALVRIYSITTGTATGDIRTTEAQNSPSFQGGQTRFNTATIATGGGAGLFGDGGDGGAEASGNGVAESAIDNSGAGGGGCSASSGGAFTATSGAGGSGRLIVEWQEYI